MTDKELKHLSDFEWASVAQYIVWVESAAGLSQINSSHVVSFPLARMGIDRLRLRLNRVETALLCNIAALERFVGERKSELTSNELAVLRTLYIQYKRNVETVKGHLEQVEACAMSEAGELWPEEKGAQEDELF